MRRVQGVLGVLFFLFSFLSLQIQAEESGQHHDALHKPRLFVFGDSLSSTQYVLNNSLVQIPNDSGYDAGRFSNGQVWVEYLAAMLDYKLVNFARAGSVTSLNSHLLNSASLFNYFWLRATNLVSPSLQEQMEESELKDIHPEDMCAIWIGGINYTALSRSCGSFCLFLPYFPQVKIVTDDIIAAMEKLYQKGARTFLIPNHIDMSKKPYAVKKYSLEFLSKFSYWHNYILLPKLEEFKEKHRDATVFVPNFFSLFNREFKAVEGNNSFYAKEICYKYSCPYSVLINVPFFAEEYCTHHFCSAPEDFIFHDGSHPTTKMHEMLAGEAQKEICRVLLSKNGNTSLQNGIGNRCPKKAFSNY